MRYSRALALSAMCILYSAINTAAAAQSVEVFLSADRLPDASGLVAQRDAGGFAKLNYMLKALVLEQAADPDAFSLSAPTSRAAGEYAGVLPVKGQKVLVAIYLDADGSAEAQRQIATIRDVEVIASAQADAGWWLLNALVSVEALIPAANVGAVSSITPAFPPISASAGSARGSVAVNQAETILRAARTRVLFPNADGRNLKIGIISDSADLVDSNGDLVGGLDESILRGELPGGGRSISIKEPTIPRTPPWADEGRAMGEVMFDVLPGVAELAFASGLDGEAAMADSIALLNARGCSLIVDDLIFSTEPLFERGPIANAISNYVFAGGNGFASNFYFGAAGNYTTNARRFNDVDADVDNFYEFDESGDELLEVTIQPNTLAKFYLHWTSPFTDSKTSFALEAYDMSNNLIGTSGPSGLGNSAFTSLFLASGANAATIRLAVKWMEGVRDCQYQISATPGINQLTIDDHPETFAGYISPHVAILPEAFAIAAHDYFNTGVVATYSSVGPYIPVFVSSDGSFVQGEAAQKPDFASLAGSDTSFFGSPDTDGTGYPNFFGTSCAAPNITATAAAALGAMSVDGSLINYEVVGRLLTLSGSDGDLPGWTPTSGYGFVSTLRAVMAASPPSIGSAIAAYPNQFGVSSASANLPTDATASFLAYTSTNTGDPISVQTFSNELVMAAYDPQTGRPWFATDTAAAAFGSYIPDFGIPNTLVQVANRNGGVAADTVSVRVTSKPLSVEDLFPTLDEEAFSSNTFSQFLRPVVMFKVVGDGTQIRGRGTPLSKSLDVVLVAFDNAGNQIGFADSRVAGVEETLTVDGPAGQNIFFLVAPYRYASEGNVQYSAKRLVDSLQPAVLSPLPAQVAGVMHPNPLSGQTTFPGPLSSQQLLELGLGNPGHLMFEANGTELLLSYAATSDTGIQFSGGLYDKLGNRLAFNPASDSVLQQLKFSGMIPGDEYFVRFVPLTGDGFFSVLAYAETPSALVAGRVGGLSVSPSGNKAVYTATGNITTLGENDYFQFTLPSNAQFPFTASLTPASNFDCELEIGAVNNYLETGPVDEGVAGVAETAHQVNPNQANRRVFLVRASAGETHRAPGALPNNGAYTLRIEVPTNGPPVLYPPVVAALLGADPTGLDFNSDGIVDAADVRRFFGG